MDWLRATSSQQRTKCSDLEFTRTLDFSPDSLHLTRARKHDKAGYVELLSALSISMPDWGVEVVTFVLGDRGLFGEQLWTRHLETLGLPPPLHRAFFDIAVSGANKVVEDILTLCSARVQMLGS